MKKEELCKCLSEAADILRSSEVGGNELLDCFTKQQKVIENFKANILFVGGFSSGKTSLINSFLGGEEVLPENITPETALATEVVYGENEKAICISKSGKTETHQLKNVRNLCVEGYYKYVYVLNREPLKHLSNFILVDMPGFDSGIEAHNCALMQYLGEAAAYVFVLDMTKGTVGESTLNFLSEILHYVSTVSFVLTKQDKLVPEDVKAVTDNITASLRGQLGREPEILVLSNREKDAGAKLRALLQKFSFDDLMMQKLGNDILSLLQRGLRAIETKHSALEFDPREIDLAITRQERQKKAVIEQMNQEKKKLHMKLQFDVTDRILDDAERALRSSVTALMQSAKQGSEAFQLKVNDILRPVLMQSTERNIELTFSEMLGDLDDFQGKKTVDSRGTEKKLHNIFISLKSIAETGKKIAKSYKFVKMYKFFSTGLALITNVVAPWLEVVIIFLPDIMDGIHSFIKKAREEELRLHIEQTVIPQVCEKLRPEIREAMKFVEEQQMLQIEESYQHAVDDTIKVLMALKSEKEQKVTSVEQSRVQLSECEQYFKKMIRYISERQVQA